MSPGRARNCTSSICNPEPDTGSDQLAILWGLLPTQGPDIDPSDGRVKHTLTQDPKVPQPEPGHPLSSLRPLTLVTAHSPVGPPGPC